MSKIKVGTYTDLGKDILKKLKCREGDELYIYETPLGIELIPYDPEFEEQMDLAQKIMEKDKHILEKLAK